jgi:A/G-specific adenine glycosylase
MRPATETTSVPAASAIDALLDWYDHNKRELPWRTDPTPWAVLVSEIMLQQTPVVRVLPIFESWLQRWPTPGSLAADSPGEAVRMWGRLGYPRRALRLHAAATRCVVTYGGQVPSDDDALRSLPGVGDYTAAAVAAFAFSERRAVLDTNVRRVHARWLDGHEDVDMASPSAAERARALDLLPTSDAAAAHASIAFMELGALVCTSRSPHCDRCPLQPECAWARDGMPTSNAKRTPQGYAGTDRQCRGRLLALARETDDVVHADAVREAWDDEAQRQRALDSLIADGLLVELADQAGRRSYRLPT